MNSSVFKSAVKERDKKIIGPNEKNSYPKMFFFVPHKERQVAGCVRKGSLWENETTFAQRRRVGELEAAAWSSHLKRVLVVVVSGVCGMLVGESRVRLVLGFAGLL